MNSDSITYLTGAGMVADLFAWFGVALCMVAIAFGLGMWLAQQRKRRVARAAVAMKNWEHWVPFMTTDGEWNKRTVPACGVAKSCNECSTCPDLESK